MGQQVTISRFFCRLPGGPGGKGSGVAVSKLEHGQREKVEEDVDPVERTPKRLRSRTDAEEMPTVPLDDSSLSCDIDTTAKPAKVAISETGKPSKRQKPAGQFALGMYARRTDGEPSTPVARMTERSEKFKNRVSYFQHRTSVASNPHADENGGARKDENIDEEEEVEGGSEAGGTKKASSSSRKYTPLEEQFVKVKAQHPDVLLMVECGYKYRFFGDDAETASKVLRIYCHLDHNFMTASVPTHRLPYHVEKLVRAGHKVGVVRQVETAALKKAGSNKSGPFERRLTEVYTIGTLVGDSLGGITLLNGKNGHENVAASYILSLYESPATTVAAESSDQSGEAVSLELVALDVSTGEGIFDSFVDNELRQELESRLVSLEPVELLLPDSRVSVRTQTLLKSFCSGRSVRQERLSRQRFLAVPSAPQALIQDDELSSCKHALSGLNSYAKEFHLESALSSPSMFERFTGKTVTTLDASILRNFDILENSEDGSRRGTLYSFLRRTDTSFGARELRRWLLHPLVHPLAIRKRLDAVEELRRYELRDAESEQLSQLLKVMSSLPDLERSLPRIQYQVCNPAEFWATMDAFLSVSQAITALKKSRVLHADVLQSMQSNVADVRPVVLSFVHGRLVEDAAQKNNYASLFQGGVEEPEGDELDEVAIQVRRDWAREVESVQACSTQIAEVEGKLAEHLVELRTELGIPDLKWRQIHIDEYLVELPVRMMGKAGSDWMRVNQTKSVVRFRTPQTVELLQTLAEARERLDVSATTAWKLYLSMFSQFAADFRSVVRFLAKFDVLVSLARVAALPGYSKPKVTTADETQGQSPSGIVVRGARHPVAEAASGWGNFVANDINLGLGDFKERFMVLTGPNMGGKSTYIRTVTLQAILAQVGSFVPADDMTFVPFTSFFARIGASDNISRGLSTFMVELSETSTILKRANDRSLVVIDELGRGTSTHDGTAIAFATLQHIMTEINCITLFVTHYPLICSLRSLVPTQLGVFFMNYLEREANSEQPDAGVAEEVSREQVTGITFLYKVTRGIAKKSYGLNVARLAQLPDPVLRSAAVHASELEEITQQRSQTVLPSALQRIVSIVNRSDTVDQIRACLIQEQEQSSE